MGNTVKDRIEKQIEQTKQTVVDNAAPAPAPVAEDRELDRQLTAKEAGHIKDAYRTRNGALVVVR